MVIIEVRNDGELLRAIKKAKKGATIFFNECDPMDRKNNAKTETN